jgi:hypothetical protein
MTVVLVRAQETRVGLKIEAETIESTSKKGSDRYYNTHQSIFGHKLETFKIFDKNEYKYEPNKYRELKFKQIKFPTYQSVPNSNSY